LNAFLFWSLRIGAGPVLVPRASLLLDFPASVFPGFVVFFLLCGSKAYRSFPCRPFLVDRLRLYLRAECPGDGCHAPSFQSPFRVFALLWYLSAKMTPPFPSKPLPPYFDDRPRKLPASVGLMGIRLFVVTPSQSPFVVLSLLDLFYPTSRSTPPSSWSGW